MPEYTGIMVYAGLANLERENVSTFASKATAEREAVSTFASFAYLRHEAFGVFAALSDLGAPAFVLITFAALCDLEAPTDAVRTFAAISTLEAPAVVVKTFAALADLGAPDYAVRTFAAITDLIYYVAPPLEIETEIVDRRSDSGGVKYPVYQSIHKLTIGTGLLEVSLRIVDNVEIKQITFSTPGCDSGTAKVQLIDGIGAQIYESGDQAQSTIAALISTAGQSIPIVPGTTLKVVVSKTQSSPIQFIVILYGI